MSIQYLKSKFKKILFRDNKISNKTIDSIIEKKDDGIVFHIKTNNDTMLMKMELSNYLNDERYLVFINPNLVKNFAFVDDRPINRFKRNVEDHIKRKTDSCVECFKQCESCPVPISTVSLDKNKIVFIDGTTRFGYLISLHANVIPVEVSNLDLSYKINQLYGYSSYTPKTLASFC